MRSRLPSVTRTWTLCRGNSLPESRRIPPATRAGRSDLVAIGSRRSVTRKTVSFNIKPVKPDRRLEDERTALSKDAIKNAFLDDLFYMQGKFPALATNNDYYMALAYAVRDRMLQRWISTAAAYTKQGSRTVAYLP